MDLLFIDFETFYSTKLKYDLKNVSMTEYIRDSRFKLLGFGYAFDDEKPTWVSGRDAQAWLDKVDWKNTALIAHNCNFDGGILAWNYGARPVAYYDTMALARAVLGPSINGYSLRRLAEYLGTQPKGELKTDGLSTLSTEQEIQLADYCLTDVSICADIWRVLSPQFPASQLFSMDWCSRAFIEPKLVLDTEKLKQAVEDEHERRETAIRATGVSGQDLRSNQKFASVLRGFGISAPVKVSPRTGKSIPAFSRSDGGFRELEGLCPVLYAGRVAAKSSLLETRGAKLYEISKTGPWPFDVQFSGAIQTHRYSGGSGAGGNPQNFPRQGPLRDSVGVQAGYSLVVGDFAQIEARIVAWLANEPKLMAAFSEGRDIYSEFASVVYGRTITKTSDPVARMFGKTCILGLGYGMGWAKFQAKVKQDVGEAISDDEAKRVVTLYRDTYFNIPKLWNRAESLLPLMVDGRKNVVPFAPFLGLEKEALVLPSGLNLMYPGLRTSGVIYGHPAWVYDIFVRRYDKETTNIYGGKLVENISQALAGEICKIAIQRAVQSGLTVVGQVHDEIIAVVESPRADESKVCLQREMQRPVAWWPTLKLKAECGYGNNWTNAKL